jgi:transcriptional regulator of NAD metabolism
MNADERRVKILELLRSKKRPLSGTELARIFKVTRQIIVQDIAILRASGYDILATSKGYMTTEPPPFCSKKIAVCHDFQSTRDELMTFVKCGCKVVDVIVEHPLYGELRGLLMLRNSKDVDEFVANVEKSNAALLSNLTGGIHLHTVEALNEDSIDKAIEMLREKGIILE